LVCSVDGHLWKFIVCKAIIFFDADDLSMFMRMFATMRIASSTEIGFSISPPIATTNERHKNHDVYEQENFASVVCVQMAGVSAIDSLL
jgi:hypothetical protein